MDALRFRPLSDCVLIDPEPDPTYTELKGITNLVLPEAHKYGPIDAPKWGRVLAKGAACRDPEVRIGDRVLYAKFGWAKLNDTDAHHYAILRERDLLAVDRG